MEAWITLAIGVVVLASTIFAWKYNPKRLLNEELDSIAKKVEVLNAQRDSALSKNDNDRLTIIVAELNKLRARQTILLSRI